MGHVHESIIVNVYYHQKYLKVFYEVLLKTKGVEPHVADSFVIPRNAISRSKVSAGPSERPKCTFLAAVYSSLLLDVQWTFPDMYPMVKALQNIWKLN